MACLILSFLSIPDRLLCMQLSKSFQQWCLVPQCWSTIDLVVEWPNDDAQQRTALRQLARLFRVGGGVAALPTGLRQVRAGLLKSKGVALLAHKFPFLTCLHLSASAEVASALLQVPVFALPVFARQTAP